MTDVATDSLDGTKLRPLGKLEQFSSARHHLGLFNNVGISCTFTLHPPKDEISLEPSLQNLVFSAMTTILQIHPTLWTTIFDEGSDNPYFSRLSCISLDEAVRFVTRQTPIDPSSDSDAELDALLSSEHNISFPTGQQNLPLWRLVISSHSSDLSVFTASIFFHHALADGVSAVVFIKDLHSALNSVVPNASVLPTFIPTHASFPPSLESLQAAQPPPHPVQSKPTGTLWLGTSPLIPTPTKTSSNFRSLALSATLTSDLLRTCKFHGTTLTSALPIIIARATAQAVDSDFDKFECTIAVHARRFLEGVQSTSVGVYYDGFSTYIPLSTIHEFNWESVSLISKSIRTHMLGLKEGRLNVLNFSKIPSMIRMLEERMKGERSSSFDVSNLGNVPSVEWQGSERREGGWRMGRCVFSRSAFVSGSAFTVGVVTGGDECMSLGFAWQEGVVEEGVIERIIGGVRRGVGEVVERG